MLVGAAPIPASSGQTIRVRLNRSGDHQLSEALYTVALTRLRTPELLMVLAAHRCEEVQILTAERSDTGHGGAGQHSVSQQRASQRIRAAARGTGDINLQRTPVGQLERERDEVHVLVSRSMWSHTAGTTTTT